jgi:cell division protein FtsI (penicillin-binding protein 3)
MKMTKKNELLIRVYVVMLIFIIAAVVIMWRAFTVSVLEGDQWREKAGKYVKLLPVESERGSIFSHEGSLLATSVQFFEIRFDPAASSQKNFDKHIKGLCAMLEKYADFDRSKYQWESYLTSKRNGWFNKKEKGSRNIMLAKQVDHDLYKKFKTFPLLELGANGGGLIINRISKREKPFKSLASRTIGLDRDNSDNVGLEGYYDDYLKGTVSDQLMKRLSGVWVPANDLSDIDERKGDDIVTTIDVRMQDVMHTELGKAMQTYRADEGCAVLMEVATGKIRAITNFSKEDGYYREVYNHAIGKSSEPGSTFKLASVMALLESGAAKPTTLVDLNRGEERFHDQYMKDSSPHGRRLESLETAFTISSNVGIAKLVDERFGTKSKAKDYIAYLEEFGLRNKTGVKLTGEPAPYIKDPEKNNNEWYGTTIPWMAHGYELMLTPLQVLNLYNAVANDGVLMKPMLVTEILRDEKVLQEFKPEVLNDQIASPSTINAVQKMLENVVLEGTAKNIKTDKYNFAGKTGTSTVNYNSKTKKKKYTASFAGYFPAEKPKYSMIVVIYDPHQEYYGNKVAAPVFRAIADRCFALEKDLQKTIAETDEAEILQEKQSGYANDFETVLAYVDVDYQKRTNKPWVNIHPTLNKMAIEDKKIRPKVVPDVTGMGVRDAVYVLENLGLHVDLNGKGKVTKQSILPGTALKDQRIELNLN